MKNIIPIIRRKRNIKQYDLAKELSVSPSYLCKIEKGILQPTETFKKKCAKYLKVSQKELFCEELKDEKSNDHEKKFKNRLWSIRKEKGIKQNKLASMLECSPSYLSKIEQGIQIPNDRFKKKCAKILRVKEVHLFPVDN